MGIAEDLEELYRKKEEAERQRLEIEEQIKSKKAEEMKNKLLDFEKTLVEIDKAQDDKMNVFSAVGLDSQEVRHSSFLAWLFDASKPHGFGNLFLKKFCEKLYAYKTDDRDVVPNKKIIDEGGLFSRLDEMLANEYRVSTERVVVNADSRIDVLIESAKAKTVIVIENKVFTGAHDDQLNRYEEELKLHSEYAKYNKIHAFLTPHGELPTDINGEYDSDWCIFDYDGVRDIVRGLCAKLGKSKDDVKLKMILEDYMELIEKNILRENKELRSLCKQILRDHKDALEYLSEFKDNSDELLRHAREWFQENYYGIEIYKTGSNSFNFYTKEVKDYLTVHDGNLYASNGNMRCTVGFWVEDSGMYWMYSFNKSRDEEWTESIKKIMEKVAPDKKRGDMYFRFIKKRILDERECAQPFDKVSETFNKNLIHAASEIKKIDDMLFNI